MIKFLLFLSSILTLSIQIEHKNEPIDIINSNDFVILYKKGCPHSEMALFTFVDEGMSFLAIEKEKDPTFRDFVKEKYWETFPAIFKKGKIIGGNSDFQKILEKKRATFK